MKHKLLLSFLLTVVFLYRASAQLPTGSLCPPIAGYDLNSNYIDVYEMINAGQEVILILGASWSDPSNNYVASGAVNDYYNTFGVNAGGNVNAIYLEADVFSTEQQVIDANIPLMVDFPVMMYPGDATLDFNLTYYPNIYRVCPSGYVQLIDQLNFEQLSDPLSNICSQSNYAVNPVITSVDVNSNCTNSHVFVQLQNLGSIELTTCDLLLTTEMGEEITTSWTGSINPGATEWIDLGELDEEIQGTIQISIASEDESPENPWQTNITPSAAATSHIRIDLLTDGWPEEISWSIYNSSNVMVAQSGQYTQQQYQYIHDIYLSALDCYHLTINDAFGDGLAWPGFVSGHILVNAVEEDGDEIPIYIYNGDYEFTQENASFGVTTLVPLSISGQVYLDANENAYNETSESGIGGIAVHLDDLTTYTDENGNFIFSDVEAGGNLSIAYDNELYPTATTPTSFDLSGAVQYTYNFGLSTSDPSYNLNYVYTEPWFFCGFDGSIWFCVSNAGNTTVNGQVTIQLDPLLTSTTAYPEGFTNVDNTFTWNLTNVTPGEVLYFSLGIVNPGFEYMGQDIANTITLLTYDANNNVVDQDQDTHASTLYCSYDPNDKAGVPAGETDAHFIQNGTDLEYLIRFQNTGNYQAFNIHVLDALDSDLDWSTFSMVSTSHYCQPTIDMATGEIDFFFPDINLADSASNEPESHGFIRYRISPLPDLEELTPIENTAYIYFDFNPAIITNTTLHTISDLYFSVDEIAEQSLSLYPNPTTDRVQIDVPQGMGQYDIIISDLQGRVVRRMEKVSGNRLQVSCVDLPQGTYWVRLTSETELPVRPAKLVVGK